MDRLYHQIGNPAENLKQEKFNTFSPQRTCPYAVLKNLAFLLKMGILQRNPCHQCNQIPVMGYAALLSQAVSGTIKP